MGNGWEEDKHQIASCSRCEESHSIQCKNEHNIRRYMLFVLSQMWGGPRPCIVGRPTKVKRKSIQNSRQGLPDRSTPTASRKSACPWAAEGCKKYQTKHFITVTMDFEEELADLLAEEDAIRRETSTIIGPCVCTACRLALVTMRVVRAIVYPTTHHLYRSIAKGAMRGCFRLRLAWADPVSCGARH